MGPETKKFLAKVTKATGGDPFNISDVLNGETFRNAWEKRDTRDLLVENTKIVGFSEDGTPLRVVSS